MRQQLVGAVVLASWLSGCAPAILPTLAAPPQIVPLMPSIGAPPAGKGQIIINADKPAIVDEITGHYEGQTVRGHDLEGQTFTTVCQRTPCLVNMDLGEHPLRMRSLADDHDNATTSVTIGPQLTAFNMNLGHEVDPKTTWLAPVAIGALALFGGIAFTALGEQGGNATDPGTNFRPAGIGMMIGGGLLTALGLWWAHSSAGSFQNGMGVQWTPAAP